MHMEKSDIIKALESLRKTVCRIQNKKQLKVKLSPVIEDFRNSLFSLDETSAQKETGLALILYK